MTLRDAGGVPIADQEVVVAQRRHRFLFGGTDFDVIGLANGASGEARVVAVDLRQPSSRPSTSRCCR